MSAKRSLALASIAVAMVALSAPTAVHAHPLGNTSVNRAFALLLDDGKLRLRAITEYAELPALPIVQSVTDDESSEINQDRLSAWSNDACRDLAERVTLLIDGSPARLQPLADLYPSVGTGDEGLPLIRLTCEYAAGAGVANGVAHAIDLSFKRPGGEVGWLEIVLVPHDGVEVESTSVPTTSPSAWLTRFPDDAARSPAQIEHASVVIRHETNGRERAGGPPGAIGAGVVERFPQLPIDGLAIAGSALAAAGHALTPGHGKVLMAGLMASRRVTRRQLTIAAIAIAVSHSASVALLAVAIHAGAALAPTGGVVGGLRVVCALALVGIGGVMLIAATNTSHRGDELSDHDHAHGHPTHRRSVRGSAWTAAGAGVLTGIVPSTSALIALLFAVTTGDLVVGAVTLAAYGAGMAFVLVVICICAQRVGAWAGSLAGPESRLAQAMPVAIAVAVMTSGVVALALVA